MLHVDSLKFLLLGPRYDYSLIHYKLQANLGTKPVRRQSFQAQGFPIREICNIPCVWVYALDTHHNHWKSIHIRTNFGVWDIHATRRGCCHTTGCDLSRIQGPVARGVGQESHVRELAGIVSPSFQSLN